MNAFGDIPEKDRLLMQELTILERWFEEHGGDLSPITAAKGMVAMAHDWYLMDMEETGERLLDKAEDLCPGYFVGPILIHMKKDKEYKTLVEQLKTTLALQVMRSLGFNEQV